ncbi:MAG TPA: 23S rRNA (adenine(2503)-C(2))-methyltransferase RlmN [Bacteroidota bacterium]|nr:23S rRNA (adenine(2503)-C(2))-methyltransferase RlmN [Bacteroidota bacterium]
MTKKTDLKGLTTAELTNFAVSIGEQRYRGNQLFEWLYMKRAVRFEEMTALSKPLREKLDAVAVIGSIGLSDRTDSGDGTTKFLFSLNDGKQIESVLIPPRLAFGGRNAAGEDEQRRLTLCVSTQVGCALDCRFCATATMGMVRNLTAGEIVDQVMQTGRITGRTITNIVYMGMGEPLMNYDAVMNSVEIISNGLKIPARRITVSTAGWVPKIRQMAEERRKVKLAVSLHSLNDATRAELMPVGLKFPLDELMDAVGEYCRKTGIRVTFEYILFDGINDSAEDCRRLAVLAKKIPCKFNIIPFHDISGTGGVRTAGLRPSPSATIDRFVAALRRLHVTVFVRSSAGEDIAAACGQLAVMQSAKERMRTEGHPRSHQRRSAV